MLGTMTAGDRLIDAYRDVRSLTEMLAEPLSPEDQVIQSMPDVSPTKWHRAHTTWFFETFVLEPFAAGYEPFDPAFGYLFNSYYEAVGARHTRAERGLISRPSVGEVADYRAAVDEAIVELIAELDAGERDVPALIELGLHHEQQHQELLLMDIKHVLSVNPLQPAYRRDAAGTTVEQPAALDWTRFEGGAVAVGHHGDGFAFDSEGPRHHYLLQPYELANRLVTCGEWCEFMADGGYDTPALWLSDGWATVQAQGWRAPSYWTDHDGEWHVFTLGGPQVLDPAEPVCHLSYFEADAFARWAGARLPTEHEWEHAAAGIPVAGNLLPSRRLHPAAETRTGLRQLYGDVWEWTASSYAPYPGFTPAPGAVGEYNGKFMVNQYVLRGGCCVTPGGHIRPTYRNFFPAHTRWHFSGVRLAREAS